MTKKTGIHGKRNTTEFQEKQKGTPFGHDLMKKEERPPGAIRIIALWPNTKERQFFTRVIQ